MKNTNQTHQLSEWRFKAMIFTIVLSAIGYLIVSLWGGLDSVWEGIKKVGVTGLLIALLLSCLNYMLRFFRWQMYLKILREKVPFWQSLRIYIAGFSLTATPGKAGEALRSVFLHDFGVGYRKSFGALFAERFSDLLSVLLLSTFFLGFYASEHVELHLFMTFVWALIATVVLVMQSERALKKLENLALAKLPEKFGNSVRFVIETVLHFKSCFSLKALGIGLVFGIFAWSAEAYAFSLILSWLGFELSFPIAIFIYATSLLIGAITFLPGGLGGVEVAMLQLLSYHGAEHFIAAGATLLIRLTTLWFSILLGVLFLPKKKITLKEEHMARKA